MDRLRRSILEGAKHLFKICDRDGATYDHIHRFHNLHITRSNTRISFAIFDYNSGCHVGAPQLAETNHMQIIDGLELYQNRYKVFDICRWIQKGKVEKTFTSNILALL